MPVEEIRVRLSQAMHDAVFDQRRTHGKPVAERDDWLMNGSWVDPIFPAEIIE